MRKVGKVLLSRYPYGILTCIFPFLIMFMGCEFSTVRIYENLVLPPDGNHTFNLSILSTGDTVRLFEHSNFEYSLNTYGLRIYDAEFSLQGKSWKAFSETGQFELSPDEFVPGIDTPYLTMYTSSGSGSVADAFGTEGYVVKKKWIMLIEGRDPLILEPSFSVTKEGFLKISWPRCSQVNFMEYHIAGNIDFYSYEGIIQNVDSTYIIDKNYVGGRYSFSVSVKVYTGNTTGFPGVDILEDSVAYLHFENIGADKLRLFWKKSPYHALYNVQQYKPSVKLLCDNYTDTSIIIDNPGLGAYSSFGIYTKPEFQSPDQNSYTGSTLAEYIFGKFIAGNYPEYGYNRLDQVVYTNTYNFMECYDINTMTKINSLNLPGLSLEGNYSSSSNSRQIATKFTQYIYIFPDKNLSNPVTLPYDHGLLYMCLLENEMIALAYPGRYELLSIPEKKVVAGVDAPDYLMNNYNLCISTGIDGLHSCIATKDGLTLYQISTDTIMPIYSDIRAYRSVHFNRNNPAELFVSLVGSNEIEVRNASDFSLVRTINCPLDGMLIWEIDPETNRMLLGRNGFLFIMDLDNDQIIFKVRQSEADYHPRLMKNHLFSKTGYTLDYTKYLGK